ncbi:MAG: hypothetical protein M1840_002601 [Geoglossum simile]|nr:MAG: hypothetical protein M1840_002601 [Geoglossum simile]
MFYANKVLVSVSPVPHFFALSPGKTITVVNVLSHGVAFLLLQLVSSVFEALRWALASSRSGIRVMSFLALGQATSTLGVLSLCRKRGVHLIWCFQRLLFITISLVMGVILISNITVKNVYSPNNDQKIQIVGGLTPILTESLTGLISPSVINVYFMEFTRTIITDSTFVISVEPLSCSGKDCFPIFLPGGLDVVRIQGEGPNSTLFSGLQVGDSTSVLIYDAPGYQLEFSPIENDFSFNTSADCSMHGNSTGDGLYFCIASNGTRLLAGWSICPSKLYLAGRCQDDISWTTALEQSTSLLSFQRHATVAYDLANFSILSVESIGPPVPSQFPVSDLRAFFTNVLAPVPMLENTSSPAFITQATTASVQFELGWILRLYQDDFSTYENGPLNILRGFLTIPIQFSTLAWQLGNIDSIPTDLKTNAALSKASNRAIAQPWTIKAFGVLGTLMYLWIMAYLMWVYWFSYNSANRSIYPEIDVASKCGAWLPPNVHTLGHTLRLLRLDNCSSSEVRERLGGKKIFFGVQESAENGQRIVLATERGSLEKLNEGSEY